MTPPPKGSPWRPALYGFVEDFFANEMRREKAFRAQMTRRYETSSIFRRIVAILSWCWGVGFLIVAVATTGLVMLLPESVLFGVGWSLPYLCSAIMAMVMAVFVKWSLRRERDFSRSRMQDGRSSIERSVP